MTKDELLAVIKEKLARPQPREVNELRFIVKTRNGKPIKLIFTAQEEETLE